MSYGHFFAIFLQKLGIDIGILDIV